MFLRFLILVSFDSCECSRCSSAHFQSQTGTLQKTPTSKSDPVAKRKTVSETKSSKGRNVSAVFQLPLSPVADGEHASNSLRASFENCFSVADVFEHRPSQKKAKPVESAMFTTGHQPHIFGEPIAKKSRLSSSKSQGSKSRKRSSSNETPALSLASNINTLPQKDSFKVYRSTGASHVFRVSVTDASFLLQLILLMTQMPDQPHPHLLRLRDPSQSLGV